MDTGTRSRRGRFAPSPTGDLHLGGARTALVAWLAARASGSELVLRMEDLDAPRTIAGAAARILDDLRALGLDWDEGPDVGGPNAPYAQSARLALYDEALARLVAEGRVYPCWCSRAEVARAAAASSSAPHGPWDDGPRYPGTCRALGRGAIAEHERSGRRPALRFAVEAGEVEFTDGIHGPTRHAPALQVGDFVVRRADGYHAYQLAVVVDDAAMRIAEVVRGDDLLASTARQIQLHRALGRTPPRYAHVPLVLGPDRQRLSKRHGAISIRALLERGLGPERIIALLAESLGLIEGVREIQARDLIPHFAFERLGREPVVIDPGGLVALR